jgi:hypothetical protein
MKNKCLNPNCNLSHDWNKKETKKFEDALCSSCRTQLATIYLFAEEKSYDELKKHFSKVFVSISKQKSLPE